MGEKTASNDPVIAQVKPFHTEVEAGERYAWCSCGRSESQPFCDGSHAGSGFRPVMYTATEARSVLFCGCKHTQDPPFCDGSHAGTAYEPLEVTLEAERKVAWCTCKRTGTEPFCDGSHAQLG